MFNLAVLLLLLAAHGESRTAIPMRSFQVDLDLPPQQRWNHVLSEYNSSVPLIIDYFEESVNNKELLTLIETVMRDIEGYLGELGQEMKGIAEYWNVDLGLVVGINLIYELRRLGGGHPNITGNSSIPALMFGCTSIVAQDESGKVFLGRNMDWNIPDNIRNLTVMVEFCRGDKVLYKTVATVGYVGILTAVSPHGFSISMNSRSLGGNMLMDALQAILTRSSLPSHFIREVMSTATDYPTALESLKKEKIIAPVYYIVAGSHRDEGAVLTRDRNFVADEWILDSKSSSTDSWYLLETNYDHWKAVYPEDNRRYYGNHYMQLLGQDKAASVEGLQEVLARWPTWNNGTAYTAIMTPESFELLAFDIYE